jgi:di/tricarboxylate transporter
MEIAFVLGLLVVAIILFATERISVDIITFLLLLALILVPVGDKGAGVLTVGEAFEGFSAEIIIILASIFVIGGALQETGVLDAIGGYLFRFAGRGPKALGAWMMGITASVSAFMNNTTVTAMMLGPVVGVARRAKVPASRLLMPLAYASILGGTCTLIGTSTNVAVSGYIKKSGLAEIGMFEITPVGLVVCGVGILYMLTIGWRLLPAQQAGERTQEYGIREYLSEIVILDGSPLVGQMSFESDLSILDFRILKVIRGSDEFLPTSRVILEAGDTLLVEGKVENLMKVRKIEGIEIKADLQHGDLALAGSRFRIAELLITGLSALAGSTLKETRFRERYGLMALALYRHGQTVQEKLGDAVLRVGDVLLVQGPDARLAGLQPSDGLAVLDEVRQSMYHPKRGLFTVAAFLLAVLAGTFGWVPLSVGFLGAALVTVIAGCITVERAYEFIDWRLLVLIAGMTAFGTAMERSGADLFLADIVVRWFSPFGAMAVLAGFVGLTIVLTQPMSNAAAALVVLPVAMAAAERMGAEPRTFAIGIMLAASVSFIAPFEPSSVLVYGPGRYRFWDFVKVGTGLTCVCAAVVLLLIPQFWPVMAR